MDGIDFLWQQVTSQMADEMQLVDSRANDDAISCYCCGRPSGEWGVPYYQLRVDTYLQTDVPICAPCNALFHGSYRYMGIEKGTPEKPLVPGKLGMLVGCGLIVTQQRNLLLTNPGWDKRLRVATQPLFELHQVSGIGAMEYACHLIGGLSEEAFPLLYISDIGRKKAELVTNLKLTLSKAQIQVCSGELVFRTNTELLDAIREMQQADKSGWKKLERFIVNGCHGRIAPSDEGLHAFLSDNPEALAIARRLPADPHEKLQLMKIV
ncbi:hypothetical protein ACTL6P_04410 [Endozoicomonas acroporae]|uniref:hypothetical protein n=1 Tax=Endozoicomonas acroporae TaxID=1701104 RepID=UPI000C77B123|nr:hypothetical protein [Endozoicomonas acroporae]